MQLAFTTVADLHDLLEQEGTALDYREAWPRLFPVTNCPPELMHKLVADIVREDERFVWESDVLIGLTAWQARRHDLADVAFTVVDLETTGATPGFCKITEIGAVRIEGGREAGTFSTLVDPGIAIPPMITGLTGIDEAMVAGAPGIDRVLPRFVEFAADSVLVAHNAQFDLSFLDYELGRLQRRTLPRPALDTLRLARKLCPGQRCSLTALAERFDTRVKPKHRALQDAQATAELLLLFLSRLQEQGMNTLEEVARFCETGARRNYHKISLTEGLPTRPGVYIMRDDKGAALYIGKAENLRRRTRDHFLQRQAYYARQALELLDRIEVIETGSEFAALLLEQRLIARQRPIYNSHGTRVASYHYVKLSHEEFPRLYATPNLRDDGSTYAGPFRKASLARRFVDCVTGVYPLRTCVHLPKARAAAPTLTDATAAEGTAASPATAAAEGAAAPTDHACPRAGTGACLAPCRGTLNGEYADVAAEVRRVLEGHGEGIDARLVARQAELVQALAFEQAGRLQAQRETLDRALRSVRRLRAARHGNAVIVYPAKRAGWVALWGVRGGRVAVEREVGRAAFGEEAARQFLGELAAADAPRLPLPADLLDEMMLVHSWLQSHAEAVNVLDLRPFIAGRQSLEAAANGLTGRVRLCAPDAAHGGESPADPAT